MRDGSVEVLSSVQDIGTGIGTVLAQVVAEVLGLRPEEITVRIGDTEFPAGPPSYGSRTTASITPPARTAAWRVLQLLFREAALALNAAAEDLIARDGRILVRDDAEPRHELSRGRRPAAHGSHQRRGLAQRRLRRVSPADGGCRPGAAGSGRRPVCRGGRRYRDRHRAGRARGGGPGLRPADQSAADREPGAGRRADGTVLRPVRGPHPRSAHRPHGQSEPGAVQAGRPARDAGDRCRAPGELSGAERDRRLWHRRARQYRHRPGDRQCRLQRDRRSPARLADDAGGGPRGARQDSRRGADGHEPLRLGERENDLRRRRRRHRRPSPTR